MYLFWDSWKTIRLTTRLGQASLPHDHEVDDGQQQMLEEDAQLEELLPPPSQLVVDDLAQKSVIVVEGRLAL